MQATFMTKDDLVRYIIARMGGDCAEIEMVVEENHGLGHIHLAIQDTEDWFYRYCFDEAAFMDAMVLRLKAGVIEYRVPDEVMNVIEVSPSYGNTFSPMMAWDVGPGESLMGVGGAGLGGMGQFDLITYSGALRYLQDVKKLVGTQYNIKLHPVDHMLRIYPTPKSDRVAIATVYMKAKKSELYNNVVFREMATAKAKMQLGEILGKDDCPIPGNAKVNAEGIYNKALAQYEKMEKILKEESPGPMMMTDLS